jgi:hypothetical protein
LELSHTAIFPRLSLERFVFILICIINTDTKM